MKQKHSGLTVEQFFTLKETITANLIRNLEIDKLNTKGSPRACNVYKAREYFTVEKDKDELLGLTEVVEFAKSVNGNVDHNIIEGLGRVGYETGIRYCVTYTKLIDEVNEPLVKYSVHKALRSLMGLKPYNDIDCKLMQLFKEGKLGWEDLVIAHRTDCSL